MAAPSELASVASLREGSLVSQAAGLTRSAIMKTVLCEPLSRELAPVFVPLNEGELQDVPPLGLANTGSELQHWTEALLHIAKIRLRGCLSSSDGFQEIEELDRAHTIFFWRELRSTLTDGVKSALVVPSTCAVHVVALEAGAWDEPNAAHFDPENIQAIMKRPSFDRILLHLTKGPNGFLGGASTAPFYAWGQYFFGFADPYEKEGVCIDGEQVLRPSKLRYRDAYTLQDGEVTGLSGAYHLAAQIRRGQISQQYQVASQRPTYNTHDPTDSSGCPVRHTYRDPAGEMREPLIFAAKNFVIQAMQDSAELSRKILARASL